MTNQNLYLENLVIGDVACTTLRHTIMFTYSYANTPLGQSEHAYYLGYFINTGMMLIHEINVFELPSEMDFQCMTLAVIKVT